MSEVDLERHLQEIEENRLAWQQKPALRKVYRSFHRKIQSWLSQKDGSTVELGSGIGSIKETIPDCITTDLFENPGVDQCETAYALTFSENSVANLILFDVFHHLHYPGNAFEEFFRVLVPGGRVIVFDPYVGLFGRVIYGLFHHEPIDFRACRDWWAPDGWTPEDDTYFAAQGRLRSAFWTNVNRVDGFGMIHKSRESGFAYLGTGGFRGRELSPSSLHPVLSRIDDWISPFFAVRGLVVLEKDYS